MFGLLSSQFSYNDKIRPFIALAPIAFVSRSTTIWTLFSKYPVYDQFLLWIGGPVIDRVSVLFDQICELTLIGCSLCQSAYKLINTSPPLAPPLECHRMSVWHQSASTAYKNMVQWSQMHRSGRFCRFDHGKRINQQVYGQVAPPDYDVTKITNKHIAFLWAVNDAYTNATDVSKLATILKDNLILNHQINDVNFGHLDFLWSSNCGKLVNRIVLDVLEQYN